VGFHHVRVFPAQDEPVYPVGFKVARFHPAEPFNRLHFGHNAGADQVSDEAHDFGELRLHQYTLALFLTFKNLYRCVMYQTKSFFIFYFISKVIILN